MLTFLFQVSVSLKLITAVSKSTLEFQNPSIYNSEPKYKLLFETEMNIENKDNLPRHVYTFQIFLDSTVLNIETQTINGKVEVLSKSRKQLGSICFVIQYRDVLDQQPFRKTLFDLPFRYTLQAEQEIQTFIYGKTESGYIWPCVSSFCFKFSTSEDVSENSFRTSKNPLQDHTEKQSKNCKKIGYEEANSKKNVSFELEKTSLYFNFYCSTDLNQNKIFTGCCCEDPVIHEGGFNKDEKLNIPSKVITFPSDKSELLHKTAVEMNSPMAVINPDYYTLNDYKTNFPYFNNNELLEMIKKKHERNLEILEDMSYESKATNENFQNHEYYFEKLKKLDLNATNVKFDLSVDIARITHYFESKELKICIWYSSEESDYIAEFRPDGNTELMLHVIPSIQKETNKAEKNFKFRKVEGDSESSENYFFICEKNEDIDLQSMPDLSLENLSEKNIVSSEKENETDEAGVKERVSIEETSVK